MIQIKSDGATKKLLLHSQILGVAKIIRLLALLTTRRINVKMKTSTMPT